MTERIGGGIVVSIPCDVNRTGQIKFQSGYVEGIVRRTSLTEKCRKLVEGDRALGINREVVRDGVYPSSFMAVMSRETKR